MSKSIFLRKLGAGTLVIRFSDPLIPTIIIDHDNIVNLLNYPGVTLENLHKANLKDVVRSGSVKMWSAGKEISSEDIILKDRKSTPS